jgi:hypothetical protein
MVRIHTDNTEKPFTCDFPGCEKRFTFKKEVDNHMIMHKEKSEICHVCGEKFRHKQSLRRHLQVMMMMMMT